MPDDLLRMLEEMDKSATAGPWRAETDGTLPLTFNVDPLGLEDSEMGWGLLCEWDARLIVALRNSLPALLDVLRAADAIVREPCMSVQHSTAMIAYDAARARFAQAIKEGKDDARRTDSRGRAEGDRSGDALGYRRARGKRRGTS